MSLWVQVVYLEVILGRRSEGVGERDRKGGSVSAGTLDVDVDAGCWHSILLETL